MLNIQQYVKVESIEEAYDLLQKNRNNQIIAGMLWLKMQNRIVPIGIDLSKLSLDMIEESESEFVIGAMCSLRSLETHPTLNACTNNVIKDSVKDIVGVAFRNLATIGGSVYSRFGFSDIVCALLCLDCDVVLHKAGRIALETYMDMPYDKDLITHIIIKKKDYQSGFACVRKSATDISLLNVALTKQEESYRICVGARPQKAVVFYEDACLDIQEVVKNVQGKVECASNMRASEEYRKALVKACIYKAFQKIEGEALCK